MSGKSADKLQKGTRNRGFRFPAILIDPANLTTALAAAQSNNVTNFILFGRVSMINRFLDVAAALKLTDEDMGLYFVTKSAARIKCPGCKSASMLLLQPTKSTAGEYGHTAALTAVSHEDKLDAFFFYDISRYLVHTIHDLMMTGQWPGRMILEPCGSSLTPRQRQQRQQLKFGSELAMDGFYGKYGRFHVDDFKSGGISFQDVRIRVAKIDFLRGDLYDNKLSEWNFHQTHGHFIYSVCLF